MSAELSPIVTVTAGETVLKKVSSNLTLVIGEPCPWSVVLDNSDGDYNPGADIANPRTYSTMLNLHVELDEEEWVSPDLVLEDYDYDTGVVTLSGRCRLEGLDREDQFMDDAEDSTVAEVLAEIGTEYGYSVSGAPSRVVKLFHRIGNPLQWFRDLLYPTHTFGMGEGNQIVVESITSNPEGPSYVDDEDLEILRFKRSSEIYNRATVERVVPTSGLVELFNESRSGGDEIGTSEIIPLSEPSRNIRIRVKKGKRGVITGFQFLDEDDNPVGAQPLLHNAYVNNAAAYGFRFTYEITPDANAHGPWEPEWEIFIEGYPLDIDPVPEEGYSATSTVGSGDRPYPEPFTSLALESQADATAAAAALTSLGTRQGNILNFSTRLRPLKIPVPNQSCDVTDYQAGFDEPWIIESTNIAEDEGGDTGTISAEATRSEAS